MNNLASALFKRTRPGKLDTEEDPCIEEGVNPKIQDKNSITPKN